MRIGIVGAGGIGSYYAATLSRAGHDVLLYTRGAHLDAVRTSGLELRHAGTSTVTHPTATTDAGDVAACDAVIVSVKSYDLASVAEVLKSTAQRGAAIVPLLNGVDVADRLVALGVERAAVVGGLATVSVARVAPGVVERRSAFDRVVIGELDGRVSERVERLVAALRDAECDAAASATIQLDLWRKFAFIVPMVVACGLARTPVGPLLAIAPGRQLVTDALAELAAVSRAGEPRLSDADETRIRGELLALAPAMRPSFLADLERGGPTESELFNGTVSRLGRERGVPTPIHDVATAVFAVLTQG